MRALLRSGVLVLVALAFGATFVLLGIASVTLRSQCEGEWSLTGCVQDAPAAAVAQPAAAAAPESTDARDPIPVLSERDRALQAANGWIGETFEDLAAMPQRSSQAAAATPEPAAVDAQPIAAAPEPVAEVAVAVEDAPEPTAMVARRTVTTVNVDASGQPIWPTRSAAADAAEAQAVPSARSGEDEAAVSAYAPVPQVRPPGLGSDEESAASRDLRTVLGSGVNVRSGPSRRNGTVFILAPGEEVTVTGEDGGWLEIRDDQGRTGWAYSRYISG